MSLSPEIVVGCLSLFGTLAGTFGGIMTANRLTGYRLEQLEIKVDKHNSVIEKVALLEQSDKMQWELLEESKNIIQSLQKEVYHHE